MRYIWGCLAIPVLLVTAVVAWAALDPTDGFQIGCKTDLRYDVQATIEVNGRRVDGEATHVNKSERFRYGRMFTWNGCRPAKGQVIVFRLPDDRLLLMSAALCHDAFAPLVEHGEVDALPICYSLERRHMLRETVDAHGHAHLIDDADAPGEWRRITFGEGEIDIVALRATRSYWANAADTIEQVAPALLATQFEDDNHWDSPAMMISEARREGRRLEYVATIAIADDDGASGASGEFKR